MSSQARDAQVPVLDGEIAGPAYGAVAQESPRLRPELPNGVPPGQERPGRAAEQERTALAAEPTARSGERTAERPFLSPESFQGTLTDAGHGRPPGLSTPEPELSRDATRTLDVEVMYGAGGDQGPSVVRWVARLTDFLRTTATGAGGLQDRVLEGLGIT